MIIKVIIVTVVILSLLLGWILIQHFSRLFAKKYPQWGPAREEGQGCGKSCSCSNKGTCNKSKVISH